MQLAARGAGAFELDEMLPVVAEVVDVEKAEAFAAVEVEEAHFAFFEATSVVLELGLADLGVAVGQAANAELVQVVIPPAKGGLDDTVELPEMEAARHDQAAPDCRFDLGDGDADLQRVGFLEVHAGKYAGAGDN